MMQKLTKIFYFNIRIYTAFLSLQINEICTFDVWNLEARLHFEIIYWAQPDFLKTINGKSFESIFWYQEIFTTGGNMFIMYNNDTKCKILILAKVINTDTRTIIAVNMLLTLTTFTISWDHASACCSWETKI